MIPRTARLRFLFPTSRALARMRSLGAREEARAGARLREAEEIQERERRRRLEKNRLEERTRDLKRTVSDLERQVCVF